MALKKTKPKNWLIIPSLALGVVLLSAYLRSVKPLGPILARMRLRGQDQHGYGCFGASRTGGNRQHNGIDLVCTPGEAVFSPVGGTVLQPLQTLFQCIIVVFAVSRCNTIIYFTTFFYRPSSKSLSKTPSPLAPHHFHPYFYRQSSKK